MCEVFEEVRQESVERCRLEDLRNLMESFHVSAKEALEALRVPKADWERYLVQLQAQ